MSNLTSSCICNCLVLSQKLPQVYQNINVQFDAAHMHKTKCFDMYVVKCLDNVASQTSPTTTISALETSGSNSIFNLAQSMALQPTLLLTKQCRTQTDSYYIQFVKEIEPTGSVKLVWGEIEAH